MPQGLYDLYYDVQNAASNYRGSIEALQAALNAEHPVLYIATADMKQYWFMKIETATLQSDTNGAYAISVSGRGIRVYLTSPVSPTNLLNDTTRLIGERLPGSSVDIVHSVLNNCIQRYEVFGCSTMNITPARIIISDLLRTSTVTDVDDYLLGVMPYSNFVGNFAKYASFIVDCDYSAGTYPNA